MLANSGFLRAYLFTITHISILSVLISNITLWREKKSEPFSYELVSLTDELFYQLPILRFVLLEFLDLLLKLTLEATCPAVVVDNNSETIEQRTRWLVEFSLPPSLQQVVRNSRVTATLPGSLLE